MSDEKELRRRLEALRLKHNDANELSLTHDCLFADLIAVVEILARRCPGITAPQKPFADNDHPHEVGSCSHCDAPSITDTKPPTKPIVNITFNGDASPEALAKLETFIKENMGGHS
jgi:hypothetical protein